MKNNLHTFLIILVLLTSSSSNIFSQCAAASNNLATPYNTNNGQRGAMFDITAINTITITCFDASLYAGTTADYEIYYKTGSHVGAENNAGAWTFLGSAAGITSAGNNVPTPLPIPVNVTIPAGTTASFYVTNTFGGGTSYTDGTAVGNLWASNADMQLFEGVGKSYPFGLTFTVRSFNGTVHYTPGVILDVDWLYFEGETDGPVNVLNWATAREEGNREVVLERSKDGLHFEKVASFLGAGTTENTTTYQHEDLRKWATTYYRLKAFAEDGTFSYSNIISLEAETQNREIAIYPNPTSSIIQIQSPEKGSFTLTNLLGQPLKQIQIREAFQTISVDLSDLPAGVYLLVDPELGKHHRIIKQ